MINTKQNQKRSIREQIEEKLLEAKENADNLHLYTGLLPLAQMEDNIRQMLGDPPMRVRGTRGILDTISRISEGFQIVSDLLNPTDPEENIEGLEGLSQMLGKDITTPTLKVYGALRLALEVLSEMEKREEEQRSRGFSFRDFFLAVLIDLLNSRY